LISSPNEGGARALNIYADPFYPSGDPTKKETPPPREKFLRQATSALLMSNSLRNKGFTTRLRASTSISLTVTLDRKKSGSTLFLAGLETSAPDATTLKT